MREIRAANVRPRKKNPPGVNRRASVVCPLRGLFWFVAFERGAIESRKDGPTHDVAGRHTPGLEPENPNYFQGTQTRRLKADARFAVCSLSDVGTRVSVAE
jgi:hypothetical protein